MAGIDFPIVGIGASAGGVEALRGFLLGLPDRPGVGIVIVTHLNPDHESMLPEILARQTRLPVRVAEDGTEICVDQIHVLPADAILGIKKAVLRVRRPSGPVRERNPIDIFFSALAVDQGARAVGIVLSGADNDGTLGLKAIKQHGGLTLAQASNGHGPKYPEMPDSAIAAGFVDFQVPVADMGARLVEFARHANPPEAPDTAAAPPDEIDRFRAARPEICRILRTHVGHEFGGYKLKTFIRRVQRRMQIIRSPALDDYVARLGQDMSEVHLLFRDLLINVTDFFRDPDAFAQLAESVLPALLDQRAAEDTIRIWVPGCSTGEEVFSLGMLLREQIERRTAAPRAQIFATDIDENALTLARAGRYPEALLTRVSRQRRDRFFRRDGGSYVVEKEIRDLCTFSTHSVIRDPPFSRIDLISCRNLLIYLDVEAQKQVIPTFHYALRPNGWLFLGNSETINQFNDLFVAFDKKNRIFRRRPTVSAPSRMPVVTGGFRPGQIATLAPRPQTLTALGLRQLVDGQVLDRYAPSHVVVNRDGDIVHFSGRTAKYLEASAGAPSRQILGMARKGRRPDLRLLLREALESRRPVSRDGILVDGDDGRFQLVRLAVEPVAQPGEHRDEDPLFLVLFIDQGIAPEPADIAIQARATDNRVALHMDRELQEMRDRLQSMVQQYETTVEELKSSNEELVSVNEELQSANEELEASKEEQSSVNEELHTVNVELSGKIEALDRANGDLRNLLDNADIAMVFLDRAMRIRTFTPAINQTFTMLPGDVGRLITDLANPFDWPEFHGAIARVAASGEAMQRRANAKKGGTHFLVRLAPYKDASSRADGVVVTIVDVTAITLAEAAQQVLIGELQHRTRNLLTVARSIAYQTLEKGAPLEAYAARLAALGRVQGLVGLRGDERIELGAIVRQELAAHGADDARVRIDGPEEYLDVENANALSLALHELATNALKFGALSSDGGILAISWGSAEDATANRVLVLDWRESGLSRPPDATRIGYGRTLIEQGLAYAVRARAKLTFEAAEVHCRIEVVLDAIMSQPGPAAAGEGTPHGTAPGIRDSHRRG